MRRRSGRRCSSPRKRLLPRMDLIFKFQRLSDRSVDGIYAVKFPSGVECGSDHCVTHFRTHLAGDSSRVFGCFVASRWEEIELFSCFLWPYPFALGRGKESENLHFEFVVSVHTFSPGDHLFPAIKS